MRTTIAIDDHILDNAKRAAHEQGTTLGHWLEDAARRKLAEPREEEPPPVPIYTRETLPRPGVDWHSNRAMMELLESSEADSER